MNRSALLTAAIVVLALIGLAGSTSATDNPAEATALSRSGVKLSAENSLQASLKFELPELTRQEVWHEGERFDRYRLADDPIAGPQGWPELPSMVRFVLIPPQSGVELKLSNVRSHIETAANPFPRQPLTETDETDLGGTNISLRYTEPLYRDSKAESFEGFWPPEIARLDQPGAMRGYRIVPIVINPVRYNSRTKQLQIIDSFDIELNYATDANRVNLVRNPERYQTSSAIRSLVNQTVVNPLRDTPARDLGTLGGSVVYVTGAAQQWNQVVDAIQPLVEWRRQMGYPTEILRVQDITSAGAIKRALQTAYDEWEFPPEFIVLVGDGDHQYVLGFFDHRGGAANPYESDHEFATLDGDDLWPDAAVGRLAFGSIGMLEGIVGKILQYEQDPFIGQGNQIGWQKRAAFASTHRQSGMSSVDILRWCREIVLAHDYTDAEELYWSDGGGDVNPTQFFNDNFRAGISLMAYRGYTNMAGFTNASVNQLNNGRMLPFVILATCNTNDFAEVVWGDEFNYADRFIHYTGGGAIGCLGTGGATHTAYNNQIVGGIYQNIFAFNVHNQGWATMLGKSQLINHYQGRGDVNHDRTGDEAWRTLLFIYNLMGDPTTDIYTDAPRLLTVTAPENIRLGDTHIEVNVLHEDDDTPALDAFVCLYKSEAFQMTKRVDADGNAVFDLDPEWTQDGAVSLTITGHNLFPVMDTLDVTRAEQFVGASGYTIDDDNNGDSRGNGDGVVNQLETIELAVQITNLTENRPEGALDVQLSAESPEITIGQDAAHFGSAPEAGQSVTADFVVTINGGFPSSQDAVLRLNSTVGQVSWISSVIIPVAGPEYEFVSLEWDGRALSRGDTANLNIEIQNIGDVDGPALNATLLSRTSTVGALAADGAYEALGVGEAGSSNANFTLSAHPFHLGGKPADLMLVLESDAGFRDTVDFRIATVPALRTEPFGPDAYGYICFDDPDSGWFATPVYNWVELNPRVDGAIEGATDLQLVDRSIDDDTATVVQLPFVFQYYGQDFEEITVSTNGWLATGDCRELTLFNNRQMPAGGNAPGMIAPFWDELITVNNTSGIYTWFDEEEHLFYIEWSQVRRLGQGPSPEAWETFQVILHDPEFWPSFTGDGDIIFQYKDVTDSRSCMQTYDTPFATIGITSPDISTGLQYIYWHRPTPGADTLQDERAIKFTTLVEFRQGDMQGRVYDALTQEPIAGAAINTKFGFHQVTDENGEFAISGMLVDSTYTVKASKRFYNDSTLVDISIIEDEITYVEFGLLHPEFEPTADSMSFIMLPDSIALGSFNLQNNGNGQLTFDSRFVFAEDGENVGSEIDPDSPRRDEPDEAFRVLRDWALTDSLGNPQIQSVIYAQDRWIVAAGRMNNNDTLNYFYNLDPEGNLISQIEQPFRSRLGLRDMEWYDGAIWATNLDTCIYQIEPESGQVMAYWKTPRNLTSSRCITFDPATGHLFLASTTTNIFEYVFDADTLRQISSFPNIDPRDGTGIRKSGFAWFRDDPDGFPLYIIAYNEVPADVDQADISIFKMNPANGEIRFVTRLLDVFSPAGGGRGGMTITTKWNSQVWVMAAIIEGGPSDRMAIFELAPNTSWISYTPQADTLEAGEMLPIELSINSADLDTGVTYSTTIEYIFNAAPGRRLIPIFLHVVGVLPPVPPDTERSSDDGMYPFVFEMKPNYPNPFNPTTTMKFSLDRFGPAKLTIFDTNGREITRLLDRPMHPGRYSISFDATELPAGLYVYRLEQGTKTAVHKMVLVK